MPQTGFALECDRLSRTVDGALYERLCWERNEAPILARLVALAHAALEQRDDFELSEENSTRDIKRFTLKIHSNRVAAICITVEGGQAQVWADQIDRSSYRVTAGEPVAAAHTTIDADWMAATLQTLFQRIAT